MKLRAPALAICAALVAGCASKPPAPVQRTAQSPRPQVAPANNPGVPDLPAAGSGRGAYYQDDGPGDNPPPNLQDVPDAVVKAEPVLPRANRPYEVFGKTYTPIGPNEPYSQQGVASWYGKKFHGQRTSSGELYDMYKMTAAHTTLPIPSYVRVTSTVSGKSVVVRINDRGPFHADRIIDLSFTAALKLGLLGKGSHEVIVERVLPGQQEPQEQVAALRPPVTAAAAEDAPADIAALMLDERDTVPAAPPPGYYVQLGSFSRAESADAERKRLQKQGGALEKLVVVAVGAVHRVLVGPFASRDDAQEAADGMAGALRSKPIVIKR